MEYNNPRYREIQRELLTNALRKLNFNLSKYWGKFKYKKVEGDRMSTHLKIYELSEKYHKHNRYFHKGNIFYYSFFIWFQITLIIYRLSYDEGIRYKYQVTVPNTMQAIDNFTNYITTTHKEILQTIHYRNIINYFKSESKSKEKKLKQKVITEILEAKSNKEIDSLIKGIEDKFN